MTTPQPTSTHSNPQKHAGDNYARDTSALRDNAKTINASSANLVRHIKEDTMELASEIAAEGQHRMEDIRSYAAKYLKMMEKEIVAKPAQSIAIAFATGAILSLMLGRR